MHHHSPAVRPLLPSISLQLPANSAFHMGPFAHNSLSTQDLPFACSLCLCQRKLPAPMLSMLPPPAHSHICTAHVADSSIYHSLLARSLTHSIMHAFIHSSINSCMQYTCMHLVPVGCARDFSTTVINSRRVLSPGMRSPEWLPA